MGKIRTVDLTALLRQADRMSVGDGDPATIWQSCEADGSKLQIFIVWCDVDGQEFRYTFDLLAFRQARPVRGHADRIWHVMDVTGEWQEIGFYRTEPVILRPDATK